MSLDVKDLQDLYERLVLFRSTQRDEGNRQVADAMIVIVNEELELLENDL